MRFRSRMIALALVVIMMFFINPAHSSWTLNDNVEENALQNHSQINNWSTWVRDQDNNKLDDRLDERILNGPNEPVNIYINYIKHPNNWDVLALESLGVQISYRAKYIDTICARAVSLDMIDQLRDLQNIAMIELQPYLVPALDVSASSMKARESVEYSPETAWELGYTGDGVVIAVLDTGVDDRHESLERKFVAGYDCTPRVPRETNPDDEDGHGTHVAGIVMGTGGAEGQYIGIAPGARLVDVKVLNDWGLTPGDQIISGIEWCIDNKDNHNIRILSISIGELLTGDDDGQGTQGKLVNTAVEAGLVVIVAAGNDGPNNNGFSSLAAADHAITVGAIDEKETVSRDDDVIASFSNRGPRADDGDEDAADELKPDLVAPGVDIMSALYSTTPVGLVTGYQQMSGTSMACPHVAGLVALMLDANPSLTPEQVKQILHESSEGSGNPTYPDIDPKYNKDLGWGSADAYEAIRIVVGKDFQSIYINSHNMLDEVHGQITISGTASGSETGIEYVEYKINFGTWKQASGTDAWEFDWDTTQEENGVNCIYIRSYDGVEYSNIFELPLKVVNIGCEITSPSDGATIKDIVQIEGTSFGPDIVRVLFDFGNDDWSMVDPAVEDGNLSTWVYSWDSSKVQNGKYTLSVKAFNGEWYSNQTSIEIVVDNAGPSKPGFLSGFDWQLIIISILFLILIGSRRSRIKIN